MNIIGVIKRIFRRSNPEKETMEYCYRHGFKSGKNFHYYSGYPIDANWPWLISVGDDVTLASNVRILAHDASTAKVGGGVHTKVGIVEIGNNVFIGADSIVLCNTRIGDNVIIGAGSVVTKDVPSNSVYAGNPAELVCTFEEYQKKHRANQDNHPIFRGHAWDQWIHATDEEKNEMRRKLKDTFGYL